jgi:tyrosine-protein kinase Etk/Wzc
MKKMQISENTGIEINDGITMQQLFRRYWPYWPLFAGMIIFSLGFAFLYLHFATPVYETTATILVKDEKRGLDDSKVADELNLFGAKKIVENEIEILHSRSILSRVVKNLFLYAPVSEQNKFFVRSAYATSPIIVEILDPDSLIEVDKINFHYAEEKNQITIGNDAYSINAWTKSPWGVIRFSKNSLFTDASKNKQFYFSLIDVKKIANSLQNSIEISASGKLSTIIDLSIKDAIPQRGEAILNELISNYDKAAIDDKNLMAANTLEFVEKRLSLMVNELDSMESAIQKFRSKKGVVDISQQSKQYLESVGENDSKTSEMNVQLAVLNQIEKYLISKNDQPGIVPSTFGIKDPLLSSMLEKLYNSEIEYEKLKRTTAENNPILSGLKNEITKTKPEILENINNQRKTLEAARNNLTSTSVRYDSMLKSIPQKEKELVEISRQQTIKNNIYSFLLQKREEAALSFNSAVSDSRLVDGAQSSIKPVSPQKIIVLALALILPIIFLIALISLRELFAGKILFRNEIENFTVIPVIAELVFNKKEFLVVNGSERNIITEQFRHLRNTIASKLNKLREKKVMITSFISEEGKSYVASNLALSFAQAGKKTVLIECDLYKPKIAREFELDTETTGLSDLINHDQGVETIQDIIKSSGVHENLFVITSGNVPDVSSELFSSYSLEILFQYLENAFDIIVIDAPPIVPVTDACVIGEFASISLFIIRHGHTPKINVQMMDEDERIQRFKNPFIVFNGIKKRGFSNSGYGFAHGYGYSDNKGYGYFEKQARKKQEIKL